jgi:hypothetical protein
LWREIPRSSLRDSPGITANVLTIRTCRLIARAMIDAATICIMRRRRTFAAWAILGV